MLTEGEPGVSLRMGMRKHRSVTMAAWGARWLGALLLASSLPADQQTQKMTARLSEEAAEFQKLAVQVLGTETLHQRALKPPTRFRPRLGSAATQPRPPEWKDRIVVSEYGFSAVGAPPAALHELRRVISVDGHQVEDTGKAQSALAAAITATDEARKKAALKQFEKHGLVGAVTDFGQLILLFTRRDLERYEFTPREAQSLGGSRMLVFAYQQLDGPEALTLIEAGQSDRLRRLKLRGEIWVRPDTFVPVRIILYAGEGDAPNSVREEASVDYAMSQYGALLPASIEHRELRGVVITVENRFTYAGFLKFGASSDVKFEVSK